MRVSLLWRVAIPFAAFVLLGLPIFLGDPLASGGALAAGTAAGVLLGMGLWKDAARAAQWTKAFMAPIPPGLRGLWATALALVIAVVVLRGDMTGSLLNNTGEVHLIGLLFAVVVGLGLGIHCHTALSVQRGRSEAPPA